MLRYEDRKYVWCEPKKILVLFAFVFILQGIHVVPSEAFPQNGFLFGNFRPLSIVSNIAHGVGETVQKIISAPFQAQQTITTTARTTTVTSPTTTVVTTAQQSNPFGFLWNMFQPKPTPVITTTTTEIPKPSETPKPPSIVDSISNIFFGIVDPFKIFQSPSKPQTTPTPTTKPDAFGGFMNGIGEMFGWAPTTTTTTRSPPPQGGRGFSGLVYNIVNIFNSMIDILDNALLINDDWVPGYMGKKLGSIVESVMAILQIFSQIDQPGGLGDIWKSLTSIWEDLNEIFSAVTSGDPGRLIGVPFMGGKILQDIGNLNSQFALNFPTTTLPPGVKPQPRERTNQNKEEFDKILNHTENLVRNLLYIQEIVENEFPNNTILQIMGNFRESLEKSLNESRITGKPVIVNTFRAMFPNNVLAKYIAEFGKILSQLFQNFPPLQMIGGILQQELIVNIGLNIVQALVNPILENTEMFIGKIIENLALRYLSFDPGHFILNLIETFEKRIKSFGEYLEKFQNLTGKVKKNFKEGDVFQQIIKIARDLLTSQETRVFIEATVEQILKIIPFDFGMDAVSGVTSIITVAITSFLTALSRIFQILFPVSSDHTPQFIDLTTISSNVT